MEYNIKIASAEQMGNSKESEELLIEFQQLAKQKKTHEENSGL